MAYRFTLIVGIFLIAYSLLLFRLYDLELIKGDYYTAKADSEMMSSKSLNSTRGSIYFTDKNGNEFPAAVNKEFPIIYAVPTAIQDPQETANILSPILNIPVSNLEKILSRKNDSYELLINKADQSIANQIDNLNIKGIYSSSVFNRFYPMGSISSQVLGFVGPNPSNNGQSGHYGIEEFYNSFLQGSASGSKVMSHGQDIRLTIDPNIQIEAEKILDNLVATNNATGGSIIVEDPQTGKILAMGATPDFNPNDYSSSSISDFMNSTVQTLYEPGSVFKVLTMAAGIDAGKITPQTTYNDKGFVVVNKARITNYDLLTHGPYGPNTTMTTVIEHSINTGAVFAEGQIGNDIFTDYLKKFGLGEKLGVDIPGEIAGDLHQLNPKSPQVCFSTAAYGQGVSVTPLEIINAIAAIANGGNLMRPYLNANLSPKIIRRVISSSTAAQVTQMMVSAVDDAKIANIEGYSLAGKTGSAFIPNFKSGGYTNKLIDSYIGFGPTSNPRFIALIRIDSLPENAIAALSVVPAFRELSQYIINYYGIPPDRTVNRGH